MPFLGISACRRLPGCDVGLARQRSCTTRCRSILFTTQTSSRLCIRMGCQMFLSCKSWAFKSCCEPKLCERIIRGFAGRWTTGCSKTALIAMSELHISVEKYDVYTLSLRSSTMLFKGLLALGWRWWIFVVMIAFRGFDFAMILVGSTAMLAVTSRSATAEIVLSRLWSVGCSGVGGVDSSTTAIVGRNREAMTILWLRKEDIDDCCEWTEWTDIETGTYRSIMPIWLFGMGSSDPTRLRPAP